MNFAIDRVEGGYFVVELLNGTTVNMPVCLCPNAKEGDIISIEINGELTNNRKKDLTNKMNSIFKKQ